MALMSENERIMEFFVKEDGGWLDFEAGMTLFGGNAKLYVKIIKTFVDNIDPHLDNLADLTPECLAEYAIEVHGVKGSLYGIGAVKEGDMAMELETAAKMGYYDKVCAVNVSFIAAMRLFVSKLRTLLEKFYNAEGGGQKRPEPDRIMLGAMLNASREFNASKMQEILQELEQYEYEQNGEMVKWLGEQVTAFGYDKIEKRLAELL